LFRPRFYTLISELTANEEGLVSLGEYGESEVEEGTPPVQVRTYPQIGADLRGCEGRN